MSDEGTTQTSAAEEPPRMEIWLCRELDPARRLHEMLLVERWPGGGKAPERKLYELGGFRPRSLVDHVLALGRFNGGDPEAGTRATALDDREVNYVKVAGFEVPPSKIADVLGAIDSGLREGPGGFAAVALAQAGFHMSPFVFKLAFDRAGSPPVRVTHPELTHGAPGEHGPAPIPHATDNAVLASLIRAGLDPRS